MENIPKHLKKYLGERSRTLERKIPYPIQKQTQHVTIHLGIPSKKKTTRKKNVKAKGGPTGESVVSKLLRDYPNMAFDRPLNQAPMLQPHQQFFQQPYQFQSNGSSMPFPIGRLENAPYPQQPFGLVNPNPVYPQVLNGSIQPSLSPSPDRPHLSSNQYQISPRPFEPRVRANVTAISEIPSRFGPSPFGNVGSDLLPPPPPPYHMDPSSSTSSSSSSSSSSFGAGGFGGGSFSRPRRPISLVPNVSSTSEAQHILQQQGFASSVVSQPFSQSQNSILTPRTPPVFVNSQGDEYATSQPISDAGNTQPNSLSSTGVGLDTYMERIRIASRARSALARRESNLLQPPPPTQSQVVVDDIDSLTSHPISSLQSLGPSIYPPLMSQSQILTDLPSNINSNGSSSILRTSSEPHPISSVVGVNPPVDSISIPFLWDQSIPSTTIQSTLSAYDSPSSISTSSKSGGSRQPSPSPSQDRSPSILSTDSNIHSRYMFNMHTEDIPTRNSRSDNALAFTIPIMSTLPQMEVAPTQMSTPPRGLSLGSYFEHPHVATPPPANVEVILQDGGFDTIVIPPGVIPPEVIPPGVIPPSTPPMGTTSHGSSPEKNINTLSPSIEGRTPQQTDTHEIMIYFNDVKELLNNQDNIISTSEFEDIINRVTSTNEEFARKYPQSSVRGYINDYSEKLLRKINDKKELQKDEETLQQENERDTNDKTEYENKLKKSLTKYTTKFFEKIMTVAKYDEVFDIFKNKFEKEITAHPQYKEYIKKQQTNIYNYIAKHRKMEQDKEVGKGLPIGGSGCGGGSGEPVGRVWRG